MASKLPPIITVLGSLNIDVVATMQALPKPGETVAATDLRRCFGGKGANQAVAAARQGASVRMIGCLGADADGRAYRKRLREEGIELTGLRAYQDRWTGMAMIGVDQHGENLIIVASGANGAMTEASVRQRRRLIESADCMLVQFEVPIPAVVEAIRIANAASVQVIVNPSPFTAFPWGDVRVETLIVNESEAQQWSGRSPSFLKRQRKHWVQCMERSHVQCLVITRGGRSTLALSSGGAILEVPCQQVKAIDTVGAGDAFAGTLGVCLAEGLSLEQSLKLANAAGALTTLQVGAQEAMPGRSETRRVANPPSF